MHVAALAAAEARGPAEQLRGQAVERNALRYREVVRPVRADDRVVVAQMSAHPHCNRLLAGRQMHLTGHRSAGNVEGESLLDVGRKLALEVDIDHPLLEVADDEHGLVHPEEPIRLRVHGTNLLEA